MSIRIDERFVKEALATENMVCFETALLEKGWSNSVKYLVNIDSAKYIVKIFDESSYQRKQDIFNYMRIFVNRGVKIAKPISLFKFQKKGIMITQYLEGQDAEESIQERSIEDQYNLGFQAGKELREMHKMKAPDETGCWYSKKLAKHNRYLEHYTKSKYQPESNKAILEFINMNIDALEGRPNTFQHDDFHLGNLIVKENQLIGIIDFDLCDWGDPYHDLIKAGNISAVTSEAFCAGQIDGYFYPLKPSQEFWLIYSVYGAMSVISSIVWLEKYHSNRFNEGMEGVRKMIDDHDNFSEVIPKWYKKEYKM